MQNEVNFLFPCSNSYFVLWYLKTPEGINVVKWLQVLCLPVRLSQNPWDYRTVSLSITQRRVSGCKDTEIGISCPLLLLEVEQVKAQMDGKAKSYVFSFSREEQLAELPIREVTHAEVPWQLWETCPKHVQGHFYLPADLFIKEYFQWEVQQAVLIFLSQNIKFSSHTKHLAFHLKKFYMVRHFTYFSIENNSFYISVLLNGDTFQAETINYQPAG